MKKQRIIFWSATGFIFLLQAIIPLSSLLFAPQYINAGTKPLGYPDYFAYALTIFEILGATALILPNLHPKVKEWAYAGLTFNLLFALISHLAVDKMISHILFTLFVGAVLLISYIYNQKTQNNG